MNNKDLNRYLNALNNADHAFGLLMDGLKKRNQLQETMVIVIADHGEAFGRHNQFKHASGIYEENVHIPCIVYNPVIGNGKKNKKICGIVDIAPSLLEIANQPIPTEWQGRSLFSDFTNSRTFFISPYSDFLFGTRRENWKYIYNASSGESSLYNLQTDPEELTNIAEEHPEIADEEYHALGAWVQYNDKKLKRWLYPH